jgi:hypothetical protein
LKDSELLGVQGAEGHYCCEEEYFYDVSPSLSSHASVPTPCTMAVTLNRSAAPLFSFPELSYPSAQKRIIVVPSKLNDTSIQEQYVDDSDVKSDSPDDEDSPLYDAESDESKLLLPEPLVSSAKDDLVSTSNRETYLSYDVTLLQLDRTADSVIHDTVVSSAGLVLSNACLTSHLNKTNSKIHDTRYKIQDTSTADADETNKDETLTEIKNEIPVQEESHLINVRDLPCEPAVLQTAESEPRNLMTGKVDIISDSLEAKTQNLDIASDSMKLAKPLSSAQPTHTAPEVAEVSDIRLQISDAVSNSVGIEEPSVSEPEEANIVTDDIVSETAAPLGLSKHTLRSAEFLFQDKTTDISSESQNSERDTGIGHSNNCIDNKSDLNFGHAEKHTGKPTAGIVRNVEHETPKSDSNSVISASAVSSFNEMLQAEGSDVKPLQDHSGSPYTSVESLSPPEPPSRSSSQGSLRKEARAGRYHKRPAPTPPPKNSESEGEDWTEVRESQMLCDGNSKASTCPKEHDEDVMSPKEIGSDVSESAVTARLVLKPGVVRSLGPDSGTKAQVFVSRTPQNKSRKLKSKSKQGDSALSRLIGLPKNQFGNLTSYLPFWHGKQEAHASADTQSVSPESYQLQSSSSSDKSSQSSDVNVNIFSCSPGQRRRAPLADWE